MNDADMARAFKALMVTRPRESFSYNDDEDRSQDRPFRQPDIVEEAPPGLMQRAGSTAASGLSAVGNLLDLPGSVVRDVATWLPGGPKPANPIDQLFSPFSHQNRTTGRDLLRGYGLAGKKDTWGNFSTGLAAEIALDPLTYLTFGGSALTRGGQAARAAGLSGRAREVAKNLLKREVGKREARHVVTPRMLLDDIQDPVVRAQKTDQLRRLGLKDQDFDRQLGGMARISVPFTDKPFSFGGKPFTWWGLTDESGVIGAGKLKYPPKPGSAPPAAAPAPPPAAPPTPPVTPPPVTFKPRGLGTIPPAPSSTPPPGPVKVTPPIPAAGGPSGKVKPPVPGKPLPKTPEEALEAGAPLMDDAAKQKSVSYYNQAVQMLNEAGDINAFRIAKQLGIPDNVAAQVFRSMVDNKIIGPNGKLIPELADDLPIASDLAKTSPATKQEVLFEKNPGEEWIAGLPEPSRAVLNELKNQTYGKDALKQMQPDQVYDLIEEAIAKGVIDKKTGRQINNDVATHLDEAHPDINGAQWRERDGNTELIFGKPSRGVASATMRNDEDGVSAVIDNFFRSPKASLGSSKELLRGLVTEVSTRQPRRVVMNFDHPRQVRAFDSVIKEFKGGDHAFVSKETGQAATLEEALANPAGYMGVKELAFDAPKAPLTAAERLMARAQTAKPHPKGFKTSIEEIPIESRPINITDEALTEEELARYKQAKPQLSDKATSIDRKYKEMGGEAYDIAQGLLSRDPVASMKGLVSARGVPLAKIIPIFDDLVKSGAIPEKHVEKLSVALGAKPLPPALDQLDAVANASERQLEIYKMLEDGKVKFTPGSQNFIELMAARSQKFMDLPEEIQEKISISAPFGSVKEFADVDKAFAETLANNPDLLKSLGPAVDSLTPGPITRTPFREIEKMPAAFRPVVEDFVNRAGAPLFKDLELRIGAMPPDQRTMAQIDLKGGLVDIFANSVASGRVTSDTIHEIWHHLSRYFTDDEIKGIQKEFDRSREVFKRDNGDIELPYNLGSIDEYVAHRMTELSLRYLDRPKPEGFLGTAWGKMIDVFEKLWNSTLKLFGVGQTRRIMADFLAGNRALDQMKTQGSIASRLGSPDSGVLKSTVPPASVTPPPTPLSPDQIAQQLSGFRSAGIGKNLDRIGQAMADSALGRQMTALFDQSVLGRISKRGQEVGRRAFGGYKDSVTEMRKRIAPYIPTWTRTLNMLSEENIIANELKPIRDYTQVHGNGAAAKAAQMKDARKIRNSRANDLIRLAELPYYDGRGVLLDLTIRPQDIPVWVTGNQARKEVADMLTFFRKLNHEMATNENLAGVMLSRHNRYFPRILAALPGMTNLPWNPNYGKLLDATHPHQRGRRTYMDGWDDGTAVINDISIDPEISGVYAGKNIKETLKNNEIKPVAAKMWQKYGDRLDPAEAMKTFDELELTKQQKLLDLAESMMRLDTKHTQHNIPLFSTNMVDAMMDRAEHSYRSMSHAGALADLAANSVTTKSLVSAGGKGSTLRTAMTDAKWMNPVAAQRTLREIYQKSPDVMLESDKAFWKTHVDPKVNQLVDDLNNGRVPNGMKTEPNGDMVLTYPVEFQKDLGLNLQDQVIQIRYSPQSNSFGVEIGNYDPLSGGTAFRQVPDPTNLTPQQYAGMSPVAPPQWHLDNIVVDADTAEEMAAFVKGPRMLSELKGPVRAYDQFVNTWKMMQTGMLPFLGFHGRNFGSGQSNNLFTGIQADPRFKFDLQDPSTYLNPIRAFTQPIVDAHRMGTGSAVEGISQAPDYRGLGLTDAEATEQLRQEVFGQGVVGERQGLAAEQLQESQQSLRSQYPGSPGSANPFANKWSAPVPEATFSQRWLQPWMMKGGLADQDMFRPGQLGKDLSQYVENLNRLAPYIAMKRQGYDPKVMTDLVNRAQVDYTMLSNFERDYMRRWFPFYSYTRRITPTVAGTLIERPGGAMGQTVMATTRASESDEQGVTPDYIRETASIPLGASEDGTRSYITGFGLSFEDPLQFAQAARGNFSGVLRELGSRLNPLAKGLIEAGTGRSLYQAGPFGGREIEDLDPTVGRILANINDLATGTKTEQAEPIFGNPWAEYLISNSGLGRSLNTIRTLTDPRKVSEPWKLALNLGTGVRIADVSPAAQDAIFRERLARIMKDLGGRMYSRPYFPDYAQDKWSDAQSREAAQLGEMLKVLNQRATARRKAKESA